jgi:hypothetical protein
VATSISCCIAERRMVRRLGLLSIADSRPDTLLHRMVGQSDLRPRQVDIPVKWGARACPRVVKGHVARSALNVPLAPCLLQNRRPGWDAKRYLIRASDRIGGHLSTTRFWSVVAMAREFRDCGNGDANTLQSLLTLQTAAVINVTLLNRK